MNLFFAKDIEEGYLLLDEAESRHCIRVLRMKQGDEALATDGRGNLYTCAIIGADAHACRMKILATKKVKENPGFRLHIAIAPPKNAERFDWFLEKSTEIGIQEITPVICEHSERKKMNPERGKKILLAAMKQSQKAFLPLLHPQVSFREFVKMNLPGDRYIAYCETGREHALASAYRKGTDAVILIGPEGDFSPEEIKAAQDSGWITVNLGPGRLRTETAGVVACHTVNLINNL
ncbi:MAG TPA: 16S rRNA (uracil(1498)-N(3))-methyltransferase [Bacteroidales bacterium]|nr:16S rRNA (uracil(1498)-N(3))-methyltransferase [Bacteroidales bacterium]